MTTVYKNANDLVCQLNILVNRAFDGHVVKDCDSSMMRVRVTKFFYFEITFFTDDIHAGIVCSYGGGMYNKIDAGEHADFAIVNSEDLATLNNGVINYKIRFKILSEKFTDGFYDYSELNNTDLYLTDNSKKNDNWC